MKTFDGLKLLVQFYDNHGALKKVEEKTGVPASRIKKWLNGGELSKEDRELLEKPVDKQWTGEVMLNVADDLFST